MEYVDEKLLGQQLKEHLQVANGALKSTMPTCTQTPFFCSQESELLANEMQDVMHEIFSLNYEIEKQMSSKEFAAQSSANFNWNVFDFR